MVQRMGTPRRRGEITVEKVDYEGIQYPVKLIKAQSIYYVDIGNKTIKGDKLENVMSEALAFLKEASKNLPWEPVLEITESWRGENLQIERYFRCKQGDKWIFRRFKHDYSGHNIRYEHTKAEVGEIMENPHFPKIKRYEEERETIIPYTEERFKTLAKFVDDNLNKNIVKKIREAFFVGRKRKEIINNVDAIEDIVISFKQKKGKKTCL